MIITSKNLVVCCVLLLGQYQRPWQPPGQYGAGTHPMAASSGFPWSHGYAPSGNVVRVVLPQRHGHNMIWLHFLHCRLYKNKLLLHVYNSATLFWPYPHPIPPLHRPHAGLGATIKFVPLEGETDYHGGGVCVVCSIVKKYYSYIDKSMRQVFFVPTGILVAVNLKYLPMAFWQSALFLLYSLKLERTIFLSLPVWTAINCIPIQEYRKI